MKYHILIIEDDPSCALLLTKLLENEFDLIIKENGLEAMLWLHEGNIPTLIIADLNMPLMNGYELIAKLKSHVVYSKIPLLIVSGEVNHFIKNRCYKAGANGFFQKPVNPVEIVSSVREQIERCKLLKFN